MKIFLFGALVGFAFKMLLDFLLNRAPLGEQDAAGYHELPRAAELRRQNLRKVIEAVHELPRRNDN